MNRYDEIVSYGHHEIHANFVPIWIYRYPGIFWYTIVIPSCLQIYISLDPNSNTSLHFYVAPGMTGGTLGFWVVRLSVHHTLGYHFACSSQQKLLLFNKLPWLYALQCQHDVDVHILFCFDLELHITSAPEVVLNLDFLCRSSLMGTTLCAVPSTSYAFSTNYHACIAMPTRRRCAPPILFWPWPPYNLLLRSCLTWIFFVYPHWWVPLFVQRPEKAMPFQQFFIMHVLQCPHDVDVHLLFCFDLDLHLTCSQVHVSIGFSSAILNEGYHFACKPSNKLSCIYYNAHMI